MSKLAHSIPVPLRTTLTLVAAAVALALTFALSAPPISQAATSAQADSHSTAIRDCNISITRYQSYHQVRMDVKEGHGWKSFLVNIDGISNESRQWPSFQTDDGIAFHMPYGYDNAGERHQYFVTVSSWDPLQSQPICESHGEFYVKGNLATKTQMIQPDTEAPADQNGDDAAPVPPTNGGEPEVPNTEGYTKPPALEPTPMFAPTIPQPRPPDDAAILRECDVNITHYQEYYQARMDINEGHGWMYFWITIDGISNENREWGAFRTEDGLGLYMGYDETNAGEEHEYFVRVSPWRQFQPHICETRGTFYVKGSPPREVEITQDGMQDGENPAQTDDATSDNAQDGNQDGSDDTTTVQANALIPTEPLPPTLLPPTRATPPPADAAILHQCDIDITRYTDSHQISMHIKEGLGGRMYWPTIDGITNENRQWRAHRTADGIVFMMDYDETNAGEQHEYLVTVSPWYQPAFCEAQGTFYVRP